MIKMLRDFTIYLPETLNEEFTFRAGYCYLSDEIDGKTVVYTVDRLIKMELDEEDKKWIEVV